MRKGVTYKCYDNKLLILDNSLSRAQKAKVNRDVGSAHREELPKVDEGEKKKNRRGSRLGRTEKKRSKAVSMHKKAYSKPSKDADALCDALEQVSLFGVANSYVSSVF